MRRARPSRQTLAFAGKGFRAWELQHESSKLKHTGPSRRVTFFYTLLVIELHSSFINFLMSVYPMTSYKISAPYLRIFLPPFSFCLIESLNLEFLFPHSYTFYWWVLSWHHNIQKEFCQSCIIYGHCVSTRWQENAQKKCSSSEDG